MVHDVGDGRGGPIVEEIRRSDATHMHGAPLQGTNVNVTLADSVVE